MTDIVLAGWKLWFHLLHFC